MKKFKIKNIVIVLSLACVSGHASAAPVVQTDTSGGPINFEGNVINAPCIIRGTSKSQTISLGDVSVKQLTAGTKGDNKDFTISLEGCDLAGLEADGKTAANYTSAKIMFKGDKANAAGDIVKLAAIDGAAQNVGVQITERGSSKALVLDTDYTATKALSKGVSSYDFPFTAYYIKNGAPVAGKANATVNFTVAYE
ncbi:fimbrial protein [Citrobacter europaeus]|uniref:fimbrial protein n=1 Tax=Citrobacter europaeus TaxID=1914243 RepID=UPI0039C193D6